MTLIQVVLWTTWTIVLSSDLKSLSWLAFHPTLNTFAILCWILGTFPHSSTRPSLLITKYNARRTGILTLQPTSQPKTKAAGLTRHQIAMLAGLTSVILGTSAVMAYKSANHVPHFTSWHGVRVPFPPRVTTLTSILFLDHGPDHFYLAHHPGHRWRRKCLVWWGRLRGWSESQASVEVSQAIGLYSIDITPDYCSPRWWDTVGLIPQRLRRPAYGLHSGAHFHPRIPLFSRQVHQFFLHIAT